MLCVSQADTLCGDYGYFYTCTFRGDNKLEYYDRSLSPLHNRCLHLVRQLPYQNHHIYCDNLYQSVDWCRSLANGIDIDTTKHPTINGVAYRASNIKQLSCGTTRANRGPPSWCIHQKLADSASAEVLAAAKEDRRSASTKDGVVLVEGIYDSAPCIFTSSIHKVVYLI